MKYLIVLTALSLMGCRTEVPTDESKDNDKRGKKDSKQESLAVTAEKGDIGPTGLQGPTGSTAVVSVASSFRCEKFVATPCGGVSYRYDSNTFASGDKFVSCFLITDKIGWQRTAFYKSGEPGHSDSKCDFPVEHSGSCGYGGIGHYVFSQTAGVLTAAFDHRNVHVGGADYGTGGPMDGFVVTFDPGDCATY